MYKYFTEDMTEQQVVRKFFSLTKEEFEEYGEEMQKEFCQIISGFWRKQWEEANIPDENGKVWMY